MSTVGTLPQTDIGNARTSTTNGGGGGMGLLQLTVAPKRSIKQTCDARMCFGVVVDEQRYAQANLCSFCVY
jgi:hypothetical protein